MAPCSIRDRFPPPWRVEPIPGGFRVCDAKGTPLVYVYAPDEATRKAMSRASLTPAEPRAIATAIARLPQVL